MMQCRFGAAVVREERIERAQLAAVRQIGTRNIVEDGAQPFGLAEHLLGRGEDELRRGIDEAGDQPGTGDAVDLRTLAGDPGHASDGLVEVTGLSEAIQAAMPPSR